MTTTGIPALTAALISGSWAAGKKLPTTMASGFFATAACMSLASVGPEASVEVGLRYSVETFSSLPALSAPVFIAPKNGSLSGPDTTITDSLRPEDPPESCEPVESLRLEQAVVTA